uniref:Uncharacterized protein n=1 Tax=Manihot esculenta TaxID=3983 RepID=A0A2C9VJM5_MANES
MAFGSNFFPPCLKFPVRFHLLYFWIVVVHIFSKPLFNCIPNKQTIIGIWVAFDC